MGKFDPSFGLNGLTDWRPNSDIERELRSITGASDAVSYRQYLQANGLQIAQNERARAQRVHEWSCNACPAKKNQGMISNVIDGLRNILGL